MSKLRVDYNFKKKINLKNGIELSLSEKEMNDVLLEFVWFFNGSNSINYLLENNNYIYIDKIYKKYNDEIDNLIKYYDLKDIIEESPFFHNWFKNWKNLEKFNINEFTSKLKTDTEFSSVWSDFGVSDSLEFRNWGIQISFDSEDKGKISREGKDQLKNLINSLSLDPENGFHVINFYNLSNIEERLLSNNLLFIKFFCQKLSYEERINWYFSNFYETGMEYEILLEEMKDYNLDFFERNGTNIYIPKYKLNMISDYHKFESKEEVEKSILFNGFFMKYIGRLFNMISNEIFINSTYIINNKNKSRKSETFKIDLVKKTFDSLEIKKEDFQINKI